MAWTPGVVRLDMPPMLKTLLDSRLVSCSLRTLSYPIDFDRWRFFFCNGVRHKGFKPPRNQAPHETMQASTRPTRANMANIYVHLYAWIEARVHFGSTHYAVLQESSLVSIFVLSFCRFARIYKRFS